MKKFVCLLIAAILILPAFSHTCETKAAAAAKESVPSKYDGDAFCFSFENESDFNDENLPIATSYDNRAEEKEFVPGAGGSAAALHVRAESAATINGIVNNGVKNLNLVPGRTYRLSAWVKLIANEIYKVAPNFNFFIMNNGTPLYEDEACTIPVQTVSGYYNLVKITGAEIGFKKEDGTMSGDWKLAETTFTMPGKLGKYFVKKTEPVSCSMFLRIGSNEHSIKTLSDYTDEFIASITDSEGNIDENGFYSDYAIDDWSLTPFAEKAGEVKDASVTNDFESSSWSAASGVRWTSTASKAEIETITNDAAPSQSSAHALKLTYNGNPNGYMELSAHLDENTSIIHNRAYKISFWAKASDALVSYFEEKPFYFKMIPERPSENRLERSKHKWADTILKKKLSQNYEKFEIIWYEPNETMLGRDTENDASVRLDFRINGIPAALTNETINGQEMTYAYSYEDPSGNTVYAGFEDFQVWFDDISIEPMELVLNGDLSMKSPQDINTLSTWDSTCFAPGENNLLPNIFGAGTIVQDETFAQTSGVPCRNVLKLSQEDGRPGQSVEVQNKTYYKISFWAKADSPDSVGQSLSPMFDRSITGPVRNSDVTEINTEGRFGYGNLTGETGDIPYYMYQGPLFTHKYTELNVNSGETLVYDDYFARMNSTDGYESQEMPTAWNYQFYNGSGWVSSNADEVPPTSQNMQLTDEWKKYECFYRWDYEGDHYRLPKFKIAASGPADFRLADIQIQKLNKLDDEIKIDNLHAEDTGASLYVGNYFTIYYDFETVNDDVEEGNSILKFLSGDENGNYAVIGMTYCKGDSKTLLRIPDMLLGSRPGIEIIPKSKTGETGAVCRVQFEQIVAGKVLPSLSIKGADAEYEIESVFAPNFTQPKVDVCLAFYSSENQLLKTVYIPVETQTAANVLHGAAPLDGAAKVKLFAVESFSSMLPCCDSKTALSFPKNNTPFDGQEQITVAFLGGSPMCGKGLYAPETDSYSAFISEYFQDTYYNKTIQLVQSAKDGSTTADGLLRTADVAARQPDVVFIDFSADDGGLDMRSELRKMVNLLCSGEKIPYIIFLYAADRGYTNLSRYHSLVAEEFSIPQIDLSGALRTHLNGSDAVSEGYLYDEIHPSAEGHIVYADTIIRALETGNYYCKPKTN